MNRRRFLQTASCGLLVGTTSLPAIAATNTEKRFIFVFNPGGWDPTRVFAAEFSNNMVDMESTATTATVGNISFVAHPNRPSVSSFFQNFYHDLLVINGMQVRSIAHEICTLIAMTGNTTDGSPDWTAILAAHAQNAYSLPHLVITGPSFPGKYGANVARSGSNGQLDGLLSGNIMEFIETEQHNLQLSTRAHRNILDSYVVGRGRAFQQKMKVGRAQDLSASFLDAQQAGISLQDYRYMMNFSGNTMNANIDVAIDALRLGVSRCITLSGPTGWDSHAQNDETQSGLFENLFEGLGYLKNKLDTTRNLSGVPLAENTIVVVLSEMGRTPQLNATAGKDHWPYTSMLLWGSGIQGNRTIGKFDDYYLGMSIDPQTGDLAESGEILSVEGIGAGLLQLCDIDPTQYIPDTTPLTTILS